MNDANDGIIATASLLQGFAGAGAGDRLLLLAATAATIAGGLSAGGAKWAEREAEQRLAVEERAELDADLHGEIVELAERWRGKGLTPETAQKVAEELTAHDALAAQFEAEYGRRAHGGGGTGLVGGVRGVHVVVETASVHRDSGCRRLSRCTDAVS
ncbi:MAG: VIT1/CCC1 transporter family protein, partial [Microbacterium sp.]